MPGFVARCSLAVVLALAGCGRTPPPLTLAAIDPPAAAGALAPRLSAAPDGRVLLSWLEPAADGAQALRWARHETAGWSTPRTAAQGTDWFVNWADTPGVAAFDGYLIAHWLQKSAASTYAYDVKLARSADDGASWNALGSPHHDGTPTEHGFVSSFALSEGFGLVWLDGRATGESAGHEAHTRAGEHGGGMTLRAARFDRAGTQLDETELDSLTCDCCPTDAVAVDGRPLLAYRDRAAEEVRDIYVLRWDGAAWSAPAAVHDDGWRMPACPVNGPAVAAAGRQVAVAWYTAAGGRPEVRLAWSNDGGETFGAPVAIDGGQPVGRVELAMLDDGELLVLWLEGIGERAELRARRARPDGRLREPQTLAVTSAARASGFPRAVAANGQVYLAWTEVDAGGVRRVKAATLR
jgi:hypothetical protein